MRRRDKTSGKAAKTQRPKTLKRGFAPKTARHRNSGATGKETNAQLRRERDEALEQQTATSEILGVIRRSPTNVQPVFDAIVESASRLCEEVFSVVWRYDGELLHYAGSHNFTPEVLDHILKTYPKQPDRSLAAGRAILDGRIIHVPDMLADLGYAHELALAGNWRASIAVPMLCNGKPVGAISVGKAEAAPFSERQMQLLSTFADQAVIAIENVRLFNETQEALEQQTATSEVLQVISSSPGELEPVFQAMLGNATRLCEAKFGILYRCEGDTLRTVAIHGAPQSFVEERRRNPIIRPNPDTTLGRALATKQPVQISDVLEELSNFDARAAQLPKLAGARTVLAVPMLKDNELIGATIIFRREVRPFTDKQIELVKNFAAQAVIAIENARLLSELRQRTDDLTELLEQQTATSEILEVISNSPTDTQPAFDAIVRSGLMLFPDAVVAISLPDRDLVKLAAIGGADGAGLEALRGRYPMPLSHEFITGTAILDRREIDLADAHEPPKELTVGARNLLAGGYRAMTVMPMTRGDETIGALNVVRRHPGALSDKQRELLRTFANQAVIAIENTRLFSELRECSNSRPQLPMCSRSSALHPAI